MNRKLNSRAGVTLIEMLVVVTIMALFAAIVGPRLLHRGDQARVVAAKQEISNVQLALGQYKLDTGVFPTQELGLAALRQQPAGMEQWHGPYLVKDLGSDPWGHPYTYKYPGEHGDEPALISIGRPSPHGFGLPLTFFRLKYLPS